MVEAIEKGLYTKDKIHRMEHSKNVISKVLTDIPKEFDEYMEYWLPFEEELQRVYAAPEANGEVFSAKDLDVFVKCVHKMLTINPTKKPTTRELVTEEEWFGINNKLQITEGCKE